MDGAVKFQVRNRRNAEQVKQLTGLVPPSACVGTRSTGAALLPPQQAVPVKHSDCEASTAHPQHFAERRLFIRDETQGGN